MKNPLIFVPSITSNIRRGRKMLAPHKAGIFRFYTTERAICTCRALAVMAYASRAERLVIDSGKGKSLFCLPALNVNHHAHRNSHPAGTERPLQRATDYSRPQSRTRRAHGARNAPFAHRISAKETPAYYSISP